MAVSGKKPSLGFLLQEFKEKTVLGSTKSKMKNRNSFLTIGKFLKLRMYVK